MDPIPYRAVGSGNSSLHFAAMFTIFEFPTFSLYRNHILHK